MNKNLIYYFTGTGNSLAVAREIAKRTNAELIGIPAACKTPQNISAGASVGIIYPLYAGGLPNIVVRFLQNISLADAGYVYSVVTEGGKMGSPAPQVLRLTKAAGHPADACWWIQMPDNYIPLSAPPEKAEQQQMYETARRKIALISESISRFEHHIEPMGFAGKLMGFAYSPFIKALPKSDAKFSVSANCSECGICAEVCPADNIRIGEHGKHLWLHQCEGCLACLHYCPEEAINVGTKTEMRPRYHHPEVTVSDLKKQKGESL